MPYLPFYARPLQLVSQPSTTLATFPEYQRTSANTGLEHARQPFTGTLLQIQARHKVSIFNHSAKRRSAHLTGAHTDVCEHGQTHRDRERPRPTVSTFRRNAAVSLDPRECPRRNLRGSLETARHELYAAYVIPAAAAPWEWRNTAASTMV